NSTAAKSKAEPLFSSSGTTNYIPIFTDSTGDIGNSVIYQNGGKVGIGFSGTMTAKLVVGASAGGAVLNASNLADQDLQVNVSAPGSSDKHTFFGPSAATTLTLGVGGLEMMWITNSGNVGIGTNAPAAKLAVNGNVMLNGGELEPPGTVYYGIRWLDGSGNIQAHLHRFGAVDNNLYVTNDGRFDL